MRTAISFVLLGLYLTALARAQPNTISTYAGGGPVSGPALSIPVGSPAGVAVAANGEVYFTSIYWNAVYKLSGGVATLFAGSPGVSGFGGDGGPATGASLYYPAGVAIDSSGNVFIADYSNNRIRKVSAETGVITTVAGGATGADLGDNGPATSASLHHPSGMSLDNSGDLYIADSDNNRIRKVSAATGLITTIAGNGNSGFSGDGGPATGASLNNPKAVGVDGSGNVYIADTGDGRIRKVSADTGVITTVAGGGPQRSGADIGDNGPATNANLDNPSGVAFDGSGNLYILAGDRIRKVWAATGLITTVAGGGSAGSGDGGPATSASLNGPSGVAVDGNGNIHIAEMGSNRIRKVSADTGVITTVAGNGGMSGDNGDDGRATSATLRSPTGVAVDGDGNVYIADIGDSRIRSVSAATGVITTVAGGGAYGDIGDDGPATSASLDGPLAVAVDGSGNVYIADIGYNRIRKVSAATGVITTVAGNGNRSFSGDNGPATSASLNAPEGVAVDGSGNIYIADTSNNRIRRVSAATGVITTIAGSGNYGYSGDGGPATSASLYSPNGMALDGSGNIYFADYGNNEIRKVSAATGVITTVAGSICRNSPCSSYGGDGGPATSARLYYPTAVALDSRRNIYIADRNNDRIRKVSADTGVITTVAGNGSDGYSGDGGPATDASLNAPWGIAVDAAGNIYIADESNRRIRKVEHPPSTITLLTSNANPTTTQDLVLTATVSPTDATGSVQFFDGATSLGSVALSGGVARLSGLLLMAGTHSLGAVYSGDANYLGSMSATISQVISQGNSPRAFSTIRLTSDGQPIESDGQTIYTSILNSPATFTATITPVAATGSVRFFDGATSLGMQTVSRGIALVTTSSLALGNHTISAVYSGDEFFLPRWATPLTQQVRSTAGSDWTQYKFDPAHTGLNPSEQLLGKTNVATLQRRWTYGFPCSTYSPPLVVNGLVYAGSYCGDFHAWDKTTGREAWSTQVGGVVQGSALANGIVYVAAKESARVYAFNAVTGALLWTGQLGGETVKPPTVASGAVLQSSLDGKLYAFDAATGRPLWTAAADDAIASAPAVAGGVVYVGSRDRKLHAWDLGTGAPLWEGLTGDVVDSDPSVAGGVVYVGSADGNLYAFSAAGCNASTCLPLWTGSGGSGIPAVAHGIVYVGSNTEARFFAFNAAGCGAPICAPLWSTNNLRGPPGTAPTIANGVVYLVDRTGLMHAFDATTGATLWTQDTVFNNYPSGGGWITISDGVVYAAVTFAFRLYTLGLP